MNRVLPGQEPVTDMASRRGPRRPKQPRSFALGHLGPLLTQVIEAKLSPQLRRFLRQGSTTFRAPQPDSPRLFRSTACLRLYGLLMDRINSSNGINALSLGFPYFEKLIKITYETDAVSGVLGLRILPQKTVSFILRNLAEHSGGSR
jgi:hypothetical protein